MVRKSLTRCDAERTAEFRRAGSLPYGTRRTGSAVIPMVAALAGFAVVVSVLYFSAINVEDNVVSAPQPNAEKSEIRNPQSEIIAASNEASARGTARDGHAVPRAEAVRTPAADQSPIANRQSPIAAAPDLEPAQADADADPATARRTRLHAQLESGEFGPAFDTARSAQDAAERSQLFQLVADAQMKIGEFDGALAAIRHIPQPEQRRQARGTRAARQAFAGGSMADFDSLIELIQNETSGPWQDVEGTGGTISEFETGVRVDPNGLLHQLTKEELTGRLDALGIHARHADLNEDMARPSPLRLVSLTRLERAVAERIDSGRPVVASMKHLAGLSRIQYVFVFPEENEIVIGGPAEAWRYNENGLPVGIETGRPTLQLDDFVTVLRTFSPSGTNLFNCLIVPRQEGLKQIKEFVAQSNARGPLRPTQVRNWVKQLQEKLGLQDVEVNGVPADSRVARVIVEADYRMKLIGVGKLEAVPGIHSFFDLLPKNQPNPPDLDALRWWMTMKYDAVLHSPDRNVFEIQGPSVLCLSENELITSDGQRVHTGKAEETNRLFAQLFTKHYAELAQRDLIFADLQNIFDLALVAALIRHERLDDRTTWTRGTFATAGPYEPARFDPPKTVMTVANHRVYNGKDIVVQVAGGVRADLMAVLKNNSLRHETPRLANIAAEARAPQLPEARWWWDAAR